MEEKLPRSTMSSDIATVSATPIIREAMKLALNDKRLLPRVLVFLLLIPFFLLVLIHSLIAGPLLQKVEDSYERSSLKQKDLWALVTIEVPFFAAFSIVWLLGTATTISAAASVYSGRSLSLKDLVMRVKSKYKKILSSGLYTALLLLVFLVLLLASVCFTALVGENGAALSFTWTIRVVATALYPYLASVCALSLVIAVLEDDCESSFAMEEAQRQLKDRKKLLRAYILVLILTLLTIPICILFYVTSTDDDDHISFLARCPFMFVATALFCFANFLAFLVFTLFYMECKQQSHGELQLGPRYCSVPSN